MQNKILIQKLDEINAVLKNESVTTTEFGLFGSHAGIAVFERTGTITKWHKRLYFSKEWRPDDELKTAYFD